MSQKKVRVGAFSAKNQQGRAIEVMVYSIREIIPRGFGSESQHAEVVKHLETISGIPINYEGKGQYRIVTTGEALTSDDPAAP